MLLVFMSLNRNSPENFRNVLLIIANTETQLIIITLFTLFTKITLKVFGKLQ